MADLAAIGTKIILGGTQLTVSFGKSNFPIIPGSIKILPGSVTIIPD
jgi:hypothetical protein